MMASRIGILLVAFLSYALVASPGQPNATNESYGGELDQETNHTRTTDQMSYGSEQMGNDSFVLRAKPFQSNYSSEQDDPSIEHAQSDSRPETMRKLAQAIQEPEPMPKPVQEPKPTQPGQEPQPMPNPGQEPVTKPVVDRPKVALRKDFYAKSCPNAERIVNATLHKHLQIDPSYAAGFARLFFHDCFVTVRFSIPILINCVIHMKLLEMDFHKFNRSFTNLEIKFEILIMGLYNCIL